MSSWFVFGMKAFQEAGVKFPKIRMGGQGEPGHKSWRTGETRQGKAGRFPTVFLDLFPASLQRGSCVGGLGFIFKTIAPLAASAPLRPRAPSPRAPRTRGPFSSVALGVTGPTDRPASPAPRPVNDPPYWLVCPREPPPHQAPLPHQPSAPSSSGPGDPLPHWSPVRPAPQQQRL